MAFTDTLRRSEANLLSMFRTSFGAARDALRANRKIRQTQFELQALSDRELSDLSISRADIGRIARQSVYGE